MLPFNPYMPNNGPPNASQQQGTANGNGNGNYSINGVPNFLPVQGQSPNQPPFNNNNNNNNPNSNSLLGFAPGMPQQTHGGFNALGGLPVGNLVAQNLLSGLLANGSMNALNPNAALVNAQLAWQNQLQSVNQLLSMALSNPSQLGCFNPMAVLGNQVAQGPIPPQNGAFPGNPQMGLLQPPNGFGQQVNRGQQNSFPPMVDGNALKQFSAPNQQMQPMNSLPPPSCGSSLPHNSQAMGSQVMQGNMDRMNLSTPNQRQNTNFNRDYKGGASNWRDRSQKAQNQYPQKMNGKPKFSDESRERGNIKDGGTELAQSSRNDSKGGNRRSLVLQYSEKEIQQWREERKKYYPTKANVQKKHLHDGKRSGDAEQEAELRRQQLKSILAKQAEMGFEVPEIPPHLADADTKALGSDQRKRPFQQNGRGQNQNRFNKRGRFDHNERSNARGPVDKKPFEKRANFASKQQRQDQNGTWKTQQSTRKPTLLQKLLTEDIKRDRCSLLQAFRFMVMNSFFEDDSKPLKFPEVIVKEASSEVEAGSEVAGLSKIEELDATEDLSDGETAKYEVEEGELTE